MTTLPAHEIKAQLKALGFKLTRARAVIIELVSEMDAHLTIYDIYELVRRKDKKISLPTVYRTMKLLAECELVHGHCFLGGATRFEAASAHHDHLIDVDTGEVIEFFSPLIEKLQAEIAARLDYDIVHHRFEIYGRKRV